MSDSKRGNMTKITQCVQCSLQLLNLIYLQADAPVDNVTAAAEGDGD